MTRPPLAPLAPLETAINAALRLDPASRQALEALSGRVLLIRCTDPALDLYVLPGATVRLRHAWDDTPDTVLEGPAGELLALFTAEDRAQALINRDLSLRGDSRLLMDIQAIAAGLDLDWETPLTAVFGDVLGHHLGRRLRQGWRLGQSLRRSLRRNLSEFLQEEIRVTPSARELEDFYGDLRQLTEAIDRLEARWRRLSPSRGDNRKPGAH